MVARADYIQAVKDALIVAPLKFIPSRENKQYELTFSSNGKVTGEQFTNWQIFDDARKVRVQLRLMRGTDFCVWLYLGKNGVWEGKDKYNGNCALFPKNGDESIWANLNSFRDFSKVVAEPGIPEGFKFYDAPQPTFDWTPYQWNIKDLLSKREVPDNGTAIALVACNRPEYFKQVVEALAANKDVGQYPIFCFLDRPENDLEKEFQNIQHKMVLEALPQTVVIARPINFGCGRNTIDARVQLFDNAGYNRVFMFEDDGVPSSSYLKFTERLLDWGEANYSNVGAAQGWRECKLPVEVKKNRLKEVRPTYENWWGYLQSRASWEDMREFVLAYQRLFMNIEHYRNRNHRTILEWQKLQTRDGRTAKGDRPVPMFGSHRDEQARFIINNYSSGQDGATMIGFYLAGYERLAPVVNRMKYIGERGIHKTPEFYNSRGYQYMILDEFNSDSRIKNFELERTF